MGCVKVGMGNGNGGGRGNMNWIGFFLDILMKRYYFYFLVD